MPVKYKLYTYTEYLQIYQVDLALWSYYHSYQRTCPVYRGNCVDGGTVHLVVGTGGAQLEQNRYILHILPSSGWITKMSCQNCHFL